MEPFWGLPHGWIVIFLIVVYFAMWCYFRFFHEERPPEYGTYSNYGFSVEHLRSMDIFERGFYDSEPSDNSGYILGEYVTETFGEYNTATFVVIWKKVSTPPTLEDLGSELEQFLDEPPYASRYGIRPSSPFQKEGISYEKDVMGHKLICRRYTYPSRQRTKRNFGVVGLWYCDMNERVYVLATMDSYLNTSSSRLLQVFERYLDSFVCHG